MTDHGDLPLLPSQIPVPTPDWQAETDTVVVGAGAAGMAATLRLLEAGLPVTMITKAGPGDGSTAWAQGGLAAVLAPDDSIDQHIHDTLIAGAGLCELDQVADLVAAAPGVINRLSQLGALFDHDPSGGYALGLEGGHQARRIVHAGGDTSGAEVSRTLVSALEHQSLLTVQPDSTVIDLLRRPDGAVCGVRLFDADGRVGEIIARAVVLATGGIGQAWQTTTNPVTATGDGLALALRAGALLRDVEFVQFHPTVLVVPEDHRRPGDRGVLISEAVRGEGARLIDRDGKLIMHRHHPRGDLAPRDVVSATMHAQLMASGDDHLFLDGTGLGERTWREHFPSILGLCRVRGVDPVTEPIPVRPAEHYSCGGVLADLDGVTTVPGLYAVGEVASTGVQGANRLASNSLTEALVAGDRVGLLLAGDVERRLSGGAEGCGPWSRALEASSGCASLPDEFQTPGPPRDHGPHPSAHGCVASPFIGAVGADARQEIIQAVAQGCGVLRDEAGMAVLLKTLDGIGRVDDLASAGDVEATNLYTVGVVVGAAALARTESRGCHRRADFDRPEPEWQRHQLVWLDPAGQLRLAVAEEVVAG